MIVLSGDHPLLDAGFVTALAERHAASGAAATVTTRMLEDPGQYGRVVRAPSGDVERIVETKHPGDASAEELAIKEINAGTYAFAVQPLFDALTHVGTDNAQGEVYLGDVIPLLRKAGHRVAAFLTDDALISMGINTRADLADVQEEARRHILRQHMLAGVSISDPSSTFIDVDVRIGEDTTVEPFSFLKGQVEIGSQCTIGPMTTLIDCVLGDEVSVIHSHLDACEVLDGCTVGPFTRIRPGTKLHEGAKAGSFVEIKNSEIGEGTKVPHLSYIGDADVGAGLQPRGQHDHGQLRRAGKAPDRDRQERQHRHPHVAGRAVDRRRRLLHWCGLGVDRRRTARRAWNRARAPDECRGLHRPGRRHRRGQEAMNAGRTIS